MHQIAPTSNFERHYVGKWEKQKNEKQEKIQKLENGERILNVIEVRGRQQLTKAGFFFRTRLRKKELKSRKNDQKGRDRGNKSLV